VTLTYHQVAARGIERITALSDGVFAIAMTLIVFEFRLPDPGPIHSDGELLGALGLLAPRVVTYLMSFLTLGIFWGGQQTQLNLFARADHHLTWLHLTFLAAVALMPFSTSLLAEFITFKTALVIYWGNIAVLGALLYAAWGYATRGGLLRDSATAAVGAAVRRRIITAQVLYVIGAVLSLISTYWSIAFIVVVQLNFAIAPRIRGLSRL
jgi:uncharacterized membrane protein